MLVRAFPSALVALTRRPAAADFDPAKESRDKRKERVAKNDKQRDQNLARAQGTSLSEKKKEIERASQMARVSTASMGKYVQSIFSYTPYLPFSHLCYRFDKKLEGESKIRGQKRKVRLCLPVNAQRLTTTAVRLQRDVYKDGEPARVIHYRKARRLEEAENGPRWCACGGVRCQRSQGHTAREQGQGWCRAGPQGRRWQAKWRQGELRQKGQTIDMCVSRPSDCLRICILLDRTGTSTAL